MLLMFIHRLRYRHEIYMGLCMKACLFIYMSDCEHVALIFLNGDHVYIAIVSEYDSTSIVSAIKDSTTVISTINEMFSIYTNTFGKKLCTACYVIRLFCLFPEFSEFIEFNKSIMVDII